MCVAHVYMRYTLYSTTAVPYNVDPTCPPHTCLPILHLNEVADEAIGCTAVDKVLACCQEPLRVEVTKLLPEVVHQRALALLLDLVEGDGIAHRLYQSSLVANHQYCVPVCVVWVQSLMNHDCANDSKTNAGTTTNTWNIWTTLNNWTTPNLEKKGKKKVEDPGIDPGTSRASALPCELIPQLDTTHSS